MYIFTFCDIKVIKFCLTRFEYPGFSLPPGPVNTRTRTRENPNPSWRVRVLPGRGRGTSQSTLGLPGPITMRTANGLDAKLA